MKDQGDDLFTFAQEHAQGPAGGPVVPPFIKPFLDDQGRAFGDPLADWVEFWNWTHTPAGGEIANLFLRYAHQMHSSGRTVYSSQGVLERLRWDQHLTKGPDETGFKVSHNWRRRLAIWAMIRDQDLKGFFRVQDRSKNNEDRGGDQ